MRYSIVPVLAILVIVLALALALAAGCTAASSGSTPAVTPRPTTAAGTPVLAQSEMAVLTNGTYAVNATIDKISIDQSDEGGRQVDIYINAKNSGKDPVQLQWYSQLTAADGTTFGGVGISHDGDGAETAVLQPGVSGEARDYVNIDTDEEYARLSKGATLEVFIKTEPLGEESPAGFTAAWKLPASVFT